MQQPIIAYVIADVIGLGIPYMGGTITVSDMVYSAFYLALAILYRLPRIPNTYVNAA